MLKLNERNFVTQSDGGARGAVFHRCALQVNPHGYGTAFQGQQGTGDAHRHATAVVGTAEELGISVLAVINHNDVSGIAPFRQAAKNTGITILPGFGLCSAEGIRILCIYPPDTGEIDLERWLAEFQIQAGSTPTSLTDESFEKVLATVGNQGGVAIAAHVTDDKGLFRALEGRARIRAWRTRDLLAIQIPGSVSDLPEDARLIVQNNNPDYRRDYPADRDLAVAAINAKEVIKPEDLSDPLATCWIRMSEITVEGLRQAFLDPGSRIRLNSDPTPDNHTELVSLAWEGGLLDGITIELNPDMNVLIGGRGAGKSTVIESLRYVLGLTPVGEEAAKSHTGIVRQVLRGGTRISLLVRCYHPSRSEYRIERTVPNPPVVRDGHNKILDILPQEILPQVEVFGQHEISELTRSPEKLTGLLERFAGHDDSLVRRKADLRQELAKTRQSLTDLHNDLQHVRKRLASVPGLMEKLARFRDSDLEDRLQERSLLVREERILASIHERLSNLCELRQPLHEEVPIDLLFLSERSLQGLPGKEILAEGNEVLERLSNDLGELLKQFEAMLRRADEGVGKIRSRWNERRDKVQAAYEEILRDLQQSAVDGQEFIRLRGEIENLRPLRERETLLQRSEQAFLERRRALLDEWEEVKAEQFRGLDTAARTISKKLHARVRVEVTVAGDRKPLFQLLCDKLGEQLSEAVTILCEKEEFSLSQFVQSCRKGASTLQKVYGIPSSQAQQLAGVSDDVLMQIEETDLPPITTMYLNMAHHGEPPSWRALEDVSTGQKATAVLLLLLLESDAPLLIDQPEDDLDNRFITEGVVPKMREGKRRRQFIFATHNANIPVLGDAELIVGLTAGGRVDDVVPIHPQHTGSIDAPPVRKMVEEILEGGKDAFERRRMKYGF